jgi:hypothetical protein
MFPKANPCIKYDADSVVRATVSAIKHLFVNIFIDINVCLVGEYESISYVVYIIEFSCKKRAICLQN